MSRKFLRWGPDKPGVEREGSLWVHRDADQEQDDRGERGTVEQAVTFLDKMLGSGPVEATSVRAEAWKFGISERTLRRAKAAHGVTSERHGDAWLWALPNQGGQQGGQVFGKDANQGGQAEEQEGQHTKGESEMAENESKQDTEKPIEEPKKPRLVAPPPIEEGGIMAWTPDGMISEAEHRRRKGYSD